MIEKLPVSGFSPGQTINILGGTNSLPVFNAVLNEYENYYINKNRLYILRSYLSSLYKQFE